MKKQKSAYFLAGNLWFCIEEDPFVRQRELPEYTHLAFTVAQADFPLMCDRLNAANAKIFKENKSEGNSVYFIDPNGHKLELHVGDWQSRLTEYRGQEDAEFFV